MSSSDFDAAFAAVVQSEGGYDTTRADPGNWTGGRVGYGALNGTKYGISAESYPHVDIKNLTLEQAGVIYKRDYWDPTHDDEWDGGLDYALFDCAVNQGLGFAARTLQQAAGMNSIDGVIGPATTAVVRAADPAAILDEFTARRAVRYAQINNPTFELGWMRRLVKVHRQAMAIQAAPAKEIAS